MLVHEKREAAIMKTNRAIEITRKYIQSQFPKTCYNCGQTYQSLFEYLIKTRHLGEPIAYDSNELQVDLQNPIGVASFANCICGSTLVITSHAMNLLTYWRLMLWAKIESKKQKISVNELLRQMREKIDSQVLNENLTAQS